MRGREVVRQFQYCFAAPFMFAAVALAAGAVGVAAPAGPVAGYVPKIPRQHTPVDPRTVKRVHLIQSNHFDAGFSDYFSNVANRYITGGWGTDQPPAPRTITNKVSLAVGVGALAGRKSRKSLVPTSSKT